MIRLRSAAQGKAGRDSEGIGRGRQDKSGQRERWSLKVIRLDMSQQTAFYVWLTRHKTRRFRPCFSRLSEDVQINRRQLFSFPLISMLTLSFRWNQFRPPPTTSFCTLWPGHPKTPLSISTQGKCCSRRLVIKKFSLCNEFVKRLVLSNQLEGLLYEWNCLEINNVNWGVSCILSVFVWFLSHTGICLE